LEEAEATQNFLNAVQNYPLLKGVQTNLYKCFLPVGWLLAGQRGVVGYLHPEGPYDDPRGGGLREAVYARLRGHFQFVNELQLFAEVHHCTKYSINLYGPPQTQPGFDQIANLFAPATVDACYAHDGAGGVDGYKNEQGKWNTAGHADRIVHVSDEVLKVYAELYDEPGTPPRRARLPALHAGRLSAVLAKLAAYPRRLGDLGDEYYSTEMWHETMQQHDGTISRNADRSAPFAATPEDWVLSGPHFFLANPFNKTPRAVCSANGHYDPLDLETLPDDYLPRSNYRPMDDRAEYERRIPKVSWQEAETVTLPWDELTVEEQAAYRSGVLVPTLPRGNADGGAPAPQDRAAVQTGSHAGAPQGLLQPAAGVFLVFLVPTLPRGNADGGAPAPQDRAAVQTGSHAGAREPEDAQGVLQSAGLPAISRGSSASDTPGCGQINQPDPEGVAASDLGAFIFADRRDITVFRRPVASDSTICDPSGVDGDGGGLPSGGIAGAQPPANGLNPSGVFLPSLTAPSQSDAHKTTSTAAWKPEESRVTVQRWRQKRVTEYFRLTSRTMIGPSSERTLINAIIPKDVSHIDLGFSIVLRTNRELVNLAASFHSVIFDFYVKSTGKGHFRNDIDSRID
jgi:hypothetical protein